MSSFNRLLDSSHLHLLSEPQKLFDTILKSSIEALGGDSGSLMLLNPNTRSLDIEASFGLSTEARRIKLRDGEGITGWVASRGKICRVNNVLEDKRYIAVSSKVKSEIAAPLELDDQVIGILNIDSFKKNTFKAKHEKILTSITVEASDWIRHAWEVMRLTSRSQALETLVNMSQTIMSEHSLDEVLHKITQDACLLINAKICSLMLCDERQQHLSLKAFYGASKAYIERPNIPINESLVGVVVKRQRPLVVLNVQENQSFQHIEMARQEGLISLLSVPLVFQGESLGVLSIYTKQTHRFSNEEIRLLSTMADMSSVAIAKVRLMEHVIGIEENLRASEKLSALGWLAAEIAHEIRNPLTVMQMLFHTMVRESAFHDKFSQDARVIEQKMKHMNRILDQTLAFARSSEPTKEPIHLTPLLDDIVLLVRHKLAAQNIEIETELDLNDLHLEGDRDQLEQAILNLVLNAAQAMPSGGTLSLRIHGKASPSDPIITIQIQDTGKGIPKDLQEELFQPFLSHHKGGTGLGLALVQKTVENHGGKITIDSSPEKGTCFFLTLPALTK